MRPTLAILVLLLMLGCSEDDPASPDPPGGSLTASATVTNGAGGVLDLTTGDGVAVSATFPPGAVFDDTPFSMEALPAEGDEWLRLRVTPPGRLLEPVSLELKMPDSWTPSGDPMIHFGNSAVPTTYDAGSRTLAIDTYYFGYADESSSPVNGAAVNEDGDVVTLEDADCPNLVIQINAKIAIGQNADNVTPQLAKEIIDLYQTIDKWCPGQTPELQQIEEILETLACNEYDAARQDLTSGTPDDAIGLLPALERLSAAEAIRSEADANCNNDFDADIASIFAEFIQHKQDQYGDPDYEMLLDTWNALWLEFKVVLIVAGLAGSFGQEEAATLIRDQVLAPLMELFRDKAYRTCFGAGTHGLIADLQSAGLLLDHKIGDQLPEFVPFDEVDLDNDLHYCGSRLEVESYDDNDFLSGSGILDQDLLDYTVENEITVIGEEFGRIELRGPIRAIKCLLSANHEDKLEIWADNVLLDTFEPVNGVLLDGLYTIDIEEMREKTGANRGETVFLTVRRVGMCSIYLEATRPWDLFVITIQLET